MDPTYYLTDCNDVVCPECAFAEEIFNESDWLGESLERARFNYEDECLYCDVCSDRIPSAYGED